MNKYEVAVVSYRDAYDHIVEIETFHTTMMEEDIEKQIEETIDRINPFYDDGHKRWCNHGIERDGVVVEKKVMYHYDGWGRTIDYLSNSDKQLKPVNGHYYHMNNGTDDVWFYYEDPGESRAGFVCVKSSGEDSRLGGMIRLSDWGSDHNWNLTEVEY